MATNTKPLIPVQSVYQGINSISKQFIGKEVLQDDNLNWIDFGSSYEDLDAATRQIVTSGLITLVTEQLFIQKPYKGIGVDIIRSRDYGSSGGGIVQKNRLPLPEAVDDADVYDPAPGSESHPFRAHGVECATEYFMKPIQYRYEWTIPERWLTGLFLSEEGFSEFIAAVDQQIQNALSVNIDAITMANIRASIGLNLQDTSGNRKYNLLAEFNAGVNAGNTPLTADGAFSSPDFLRYAIHRMLVVLDYMRSYTTFYNEKDYPQHTNTEDAYFLLLSQFRRALDQYLYSDTFHNEFVQLPGSNTVATWKGFLGDGSAPDFASTSLVKDTFAPSWIDGGLEVDQPGVIGTIFDRERVGIYKLDVKQTSQYDPVGLRTNYWTHVFGQQIVDPYENSATFYISDEPEPEPEPES